MNNTLQNVFIFFNVSEWKCKLIHVNLQRINYVNKHNFEF